MKKLTRTFDILDYRATLSPSILALAGKKRGKWVSYTFSEYKDIVDQFTLGLMKLGVEPGDMVASITHNKPEWNFLDMAIAQSGAIHVSIYPNYNEYDLTYIFQQANIKFAFAGNKLFSRIIDNLKPELPNLRDLFILSPESDKSYTTLLPSTEELEEKRDLLGQRKQQVKPEDTYSIYYTSGTALGPKGAVVQHKAITNFVPYLYEPYQLQPGEVVLSYLPVCHAYERGHNFVYQYAGCTIYYAESVEKVVPNLQEINPVMFTSVPMLLERVLESMEYFEVKTLGKRLKIVSSGGAALPSHYAHKFWDSGISVIETYGLTECMLTAMNSPLKGVRYGTVGTPIENVELKLDVNNEILVRSPNMMKEYFKLPKLTDQVFDKDGFYRTGDIGRWVEGKFLQITGRKKDIFKVQSGQFIVPEKVEKQILKSPFIQQAMVFGQHGKVGAIIIPKMNSTNNEGKENNLSLGSNALEERIKQEVDFYYNQYVVDSEKISSIYLEDDTWTIEGGELTPTMKIKRDVIAQKFSLYFEER